MSERSAQPGAGLPTLVPFHHAPGNVHVFPRGASVVMYSVHEARWLTLEGAVFHPDRFLPVDALPPSVLAGLAAVPTARGSSDGWALDGVTGELVGYEASRWRYSPDHYAWIDLVDGTGHVGPGGIDVLVHVRDQAELLVVDPDSLSRLRAATDGYTGRPDAFADLAEARQLEAADGSDY